MTTENRVGVVLLAHGSRDPEAESEAQELCRQLAASQPNWVFTAAYLNREPALSPAVDELCRRGCVRIEVFPLLVFQGKHAREDLPVLVQAERTRLPQMRFGLHPHLTRQPGFTAFLQTAIHKVLAA